ncbi:apolipoprotein N-acyltransferase [Nordella sp. HKS 07]|uniref:apolipoprotein N-acyltransferase n=1 Tax=Nordella sp. HKS 07 TaxID=2712222 RepID=UPI0013E1A690|nr:apolipoprotein N-acyltransferase [Nordella sp. HKS 07]QIG47480.1 apolipoprotein N-acyltransferase [Nordella sp. HKS 07]
MAIVRTLAGLGSWRKAGFLLLAGGLAGLAMPPFNFWPLLFVAFPLFIWIMDEAPPRRAFFLGWLFGLGYFTVCFYWIGIAFLVDAATYLWMMPFMVGALAGGMALYWGLAAFATVLLRQTGLAKLIAFAVFLAIAEWLRGHLLTGFPWTAPGLAVNGMGGLAQAASLIGMPGLTLLIALWACLPALFGFAERRPRELIAAALLLALLPGLWLWGAYRLAEARPLSSVSLRIVQANIAQDDKWRGDNARPIFDKMKMMSQAPTPARPDGIEGISVVIWPESSLSFLIDENAQGLAELADLLPEGTSLVLGALRRDPQDQTEGAERRVYNSVLGLDSAANVVARYDKWRLVPGGEFLPFESILEPLGFRKVVTVPGSFTAGPGPRNISLPGLPPAAVLICYEAIFPHQLIDPAQRPDWIINVTNDGWFGESSGPYQHLAQARLRAIEQGLPLVRAANTGISAIIDAKGRIEAELGLGAEGVIDGSLPPAISATIYARAGDWMLVGLLFLLSAVGIVVRQSRAAST